MVLDSRGNPTVEVDCVTFGTLGRAIVPSGANGSSRNVELRDGGDRWAGKRSRPAVANVNRPIADALVGMDASNQGVIDAAMLALDSNSNKR